EDIALVRIRLHAHPLGIGDYGVESLLGGVAHEKLVYLRLDRLIEIGAVKPYAPARRSLRTRTQGREGSGGRARAARVCGIISRRGERSFPLRRAGVRAVCCGRGFLRRDARRTRVGDDRGVAFLSR